MYLPLICMAVGALGVLRYRRRNISYWSNGCFLYSHRIIETLDSTINFGQNIFFDFFRITTQIFIKIKVAWIFFEETKVSLSSCPTSLKAPKSESSLLSSSISRTGTPSKYGANLLRSINSSVFNIKPLALSEGQSGPGCRLGRCFCLSEVSTGHPHPLKRHSLHTPLNFNA